MPFEVVAALGLPAGARAVDVGCGEGRDAVALARRFGLLVTAVDPLLRHLELAREEAGEERVRVVAGVVEALPVGDGGADLVWCREVLSHVPDLGAAFGEVGRVLADGGQAVVHQVCRTERLLPEEATGVLAFLGRHPTAEALQVAATTAGLRVVERLDLGSETGEWAEERSGAGTRRLLHVARLLRQPDRYVERFGRAAYDIMLGDCLWHVHRMVGKLASTVFVLG